MVSRKLFWETLLLETSLCRNRWICVSSIGNVALWKLSSWKVFKIFKNTNFWSIVQAIVLVFSSNYSTCYFIFLLFFHCLTFLKNKLGSQFCRVFLWILLWKSVSWSWNFWNFWFQDVFISWDQFHKIRGILFKR